ncbi:MAG: hypothetical protein JXB26_05235 [Candidatus Aminicenantes bacterium]|nr:hypothetical protein [Candidatus Aminicenantes bacterium]
MKLPDGDRIEVEKRWLFPPEDVETDESLHVTSFDYNRDVTVFTISEYTAGVHISSYSIKKQGSAMNASGRDVFLILDTERKKIYPGNFKLGITKERMRDRGCFYATFNNFFIGDIDGNGLTDIGIVKEKIWCEEYFDKKNQTDSLSGPYYKKQPIKWYLFISDNWRCQSAYDGMKPEGQFLKLPLIGLIKSPVDFVKDMMGDRIIDRS